MKRFLGLLSILVLIAATAVGFSNTWPSPVINAWQMKMMGAHTYFPALTILIIALPPLLLLLAIKKILEILSKK